MFIKNFIKKQFDIKIFNRIEYFYFTTAQFFIN